MEKKIIIGKTEINIKYEDNYINVNGIVFTNNEDFTFFVNKLTDIAEKLNGDN